MSLLHRSTDTHKGDVVTDVMASKTAGTPTREGTNREGDSDTQVVQTDWRSSRASVGLILGSFVAMLLSAWAGLVPFVGPTFGFSADGTSSWTWNQVHALGAVVPGALGVLACMLLLVSARRPRDHQSPAALRTWGFVLLLCGAWLTVMPVVWPAIKGTYFLAASPTMTVAYWLAYASGPGILLATFGTFVIGRGGRQMVSQSMPTANRHRSAAQGVSDQLPSMDELRRKNVTF